jgi:hypothetical protein
MSAPVRTEPADSHAARAEAEAAADTHVNPQTGLATDYLNHFNEAVMLLELLTEVPECRQDFFAWHPKNYQEHFAGSRFGYRDAALQAYDHADPAVRNRLDSLADCMNEILLATREVMRREDSHESAAGVADVAVRWVKPLIARAGAIINGTEAGRVDGGGRQSDIDALLSR